MHLRDQIVNTYSPSNLGLDFFDYNDLLPHRSHLDNGEAPSSKYFAMI